MAREAVTTSSIESICQRFGFDYKLEAGKHMATVDGGNPIEVRFAEDGKLLPGRHAFMTAARKASPEFLKAYPSGKSSALKKEEMRAEGAGGRAALDHRLLADYSVEELEAAIGIANGLIDEKKKVAGLEKGIAEREEELAKLKELAKRTEEMGYPLPEGISDRIARLDGENQEVCREVKDLKRQMKSGKPSGKSPTGSVPSSSGVEAEGKPPESPEQ